MLPREMTITTKKRNFEMNRSDLISRIAELHPQLSLKDAELPVRVILDVLSTTLLRITMNSATQNDFKPASRYETKPASDYECGSTSTYVN